MRAGPGGRGGGGAGESRGAAGGAPAPPPPPAAAAAAILSRGANPPAGLRHRVSSSAGGRRGAGGCHGDGGGALTSPLASRREDFAARPRAADRRGGSAAGLGRNPREMGKLPLLTSRRQGHPPAHIHLGHAPPWEENDVTERACGARLVLRFWGEPSERWEMSLTSLPSGDS